MRMFLTLLALGLGNIVYNCGWLFIDMIRYYRFPWWWRLRFLLFLHYFLDNEYWVIKREGPQTGRAASDLIYGEILWSSLNAILDRVGLSKDDRFVDLGSGRGGAVMFVHCRYGIPCQGFEIIPTFVSRAQKIRDALRLDGVELSRQNFLTAPHLDGTIFLVAGTTFSPETLEALATRLEEEAPPGATLICFSAPLEAKGFIVVRREEHFFSWGRGSVYIQKKTG